MTTQTSVVTPERFETGYKSFAEWMAAIPEHQTDFQGHYDAFTPDAGDIAAVKALVEKHGVKAFCIGEHWCPDVWRGLPVFAKVAEGTGITARYFERDENKDIMSEFLKDGEFESIPAMVFYDGNHRYLFHWIERPQLAMDDMARLRAEILATAPTEDGPERQAAQAAYRAATATHAPQWRHATLTEWRALLEKTLA